MSQKMDGSIALNSVAPDFAYNNLSSSSSDALAFASMDEVYLVIDQKTVKKLDKDKTAKIYQLKYVTVCGKSVLVMCSNLGLQIWSELGDNVLLFQPISETVDSVGAEDESFFRGVAATGKFLCVGASNGSFAVIEYSESRDAFTFAENIKTSSRHPISSMCATEDTLTIANDEGDVTCYDPRRDFSRKFYIAGAGHPCTCLAMVEDVVFAGFSTGHIRVYRVNVSELTLEIAAHSRAVAGLCVVDGSFIASCSRDQFVHVWPLPDFRAGGGETFQPVKTMLYENKVNTGVACLKNGNIAVASYDNDELAVIQRTSFR